MASHVEDKSRHWAYGAYGQCEPSANEVAFIAIEIDGACLLFCEEGCRQAMVGTIAFYDAAGDRMHTNYVAAEAEHGKATFLRRMNEEIARTKEICCDVRQTLSSCATADRVNRAYGVVITSPRPIGRPAASQAS